MLMRDWRIKVFYRSTSDYREPLKRFDRLIALKVDEPPRVAAQIVIELLREQHTVHTIMDWECNEHYVGVKT